MAERQLCRQRILSEEYRDFIIQSGGSRIGFTVPEEQLCRQGTRAGYDVVYVEQVLAEPLNFGSFTYSSIPRCYTLLDMEAMGQAGITPVQSYPTLELMGENVMIGFVDTGIDYTHPVFRGLDGRTRIEAIWDQTLQDGPMPDGFLYGSEYTREEIDRALAAEDPFSVVPSRDESGHGTYVASLAAGSADEENQFLGAAPEAVIAAVKLKEAKQYLRDFYYIAENAACYQENDIMLGIQYLVDLAERKGLPLILCVALGSSLGGHNGTTPLAVMLEYYSNSLNKGVVVGTGNEASQRHHFYGALESGEDREEVEIRVGENVRGFVTELWTDIPNILTVSLVSPSGEVRERIPIIQGGSSQFRFVFEGTLVTVDYRLLVERNDSQLIFMRFGAPAPGIWKILVEPVQLAGGAFHMWLPVQEFLDGEVYFLRSNPDVTLTSPAAVRSAITAAFYNGRENSIDIHSGRGYTRTDKIKPDLAAPGVDVKGALPGGRFTVRSGSSGAAAITAGAAARLMEWILYYTGSRGADTLQLKNLLILGARQRPGEDYPNREWGYGTLDLYRTLDRLRQI